MKITFLGSGSAFVPMSENFQSNILFEKTKLETQYSGSEHNTIVTGEEEVTHRLLMDAGTHIQESLSSVNLEPKDLDAIFISHLHGDHCHGLEFIGFKNYFTPPFGSIKPKLLINHEISDKL
jgi:ribonuclease BN (tRNA processing enzyme)